MMTRKQRRMTFVLTGMAVIGVAAGLVLFAIQDNLVFFNSPSEVVENNLPADKRFRLGGLVEEIEEEASLEYEEIPNFPTSTATSHRGRLVCGTLEGLPVIAMEGRFHMYEGYPLKQITLPVRVMQAMGADLLVVSNACGGMNPYFKKGDLMVIEDQINLMGDNPLIGINDDRLGPRFPDMCEPYNQELVDRALEPGPALVENQVYGVFKIVLVFVPWIFALVEQDDFRT